MRRLLRLLLVVYPEDARLRYGAEIVATVLERMESARLRFERLGPLRRPRSPRVPREGSALDRVFHDLRIAARGLSGWPGFTAVAVLAMALGVGANVAIFSVFHAVLLRPLPFAEPERLVTLWEKNSERGWYKNQVAPANYLDWKERSRSFSAMAGYNSWLDELALVAEGEPLVVRANTVTGSFFDVLGVPPVLGRVFDEADTWAGSERKALLSHGLWMRRNWCVPGCARSTRRFLSTTSPPSKRCCLRP